MHHKIVLMLQVFKPERKYSERQEDVLCASEKNYLTRECNSIGNCFRCSQKHHISLCNLYEKKTFPTVVKKSEEPVVEKGQEPVAGAQVTKLPLVFM